MELSFEEFCRFHYRRLEGEPTLKSYGPILVLVGLSLIFTVGRFFVPHQSPSLPGTYQAFAHLFVGGLLGAYFADRQERHDCLYIALSLSGVELLAFLVSR